MGLERQTIAAFVAEAFPPEQVPEALDILAAYGTETHEREPDRVCRAIVSLSGGDLDRLRHFVAAAKADYRDVLFWAETPDA